MSITIPKIIHQVWIGPKPAPMNSMNSWKEKHPDFEYIFWNETEFEKRGMFFKCQDKIDEIEEINGKADIIRWEILYKYGGVFLDADSICVEPFDDYILSKGPFAGWENEEKRPGLIATGTMGFPPKHPLVKEAVKWIQNNEVSQAKTNGMAWETVGPGLLTRIYNSKIFKDVIVYPSYTFLPQHFTGAEYNGHGKIYAFQQWGSTRNAYDYINEILLPEKYTVPPLENSVSILISSYNTKSIYIKECLESIKHQVGIFNMEIVWINDGSDKLNTQILKKQLENFEKTTRFTKVIYYENETNKGVAYSLNLGITICSNELIIRMDSDDIMLGDRIYKQIKYMMQYPDTVICGGQISMFKDSIHNIINHTNHKSITLNEFRRNPIHWIVNHPTLCYRKSAILDVGNYKIEYNKIEDYELMLRILKKYKYIHNMEDILLYYRLHNEQVTHNGCTEGYNYWHKKRIELIDTIINS
jgi:GT2 family glycosyltransferase